MEDRRYDDTVENPRDRGGFLWGLLGCCIPVVGLVLFLVWRDEKPKTAKAAGIGALVSVILTILIYVCVFVMSIATAALIGGM
mgnify:FL=1